VEQNQTNGVNPGSYNRLRKSYRKGTSMNSKVTYMEEQNFLAQRNNGGTTLAEGLTAAGLRFSEKRGKVRLRATKSGFIYWASP